MPLEFVNVHGAPITHGAIEAAKLQAKADHQRNLRAKRSDDVKYHKGWRVTGVRSCDVAEARRKAELEAEDARKAGRDPKPFDEQQWIMNAKGKSVRSKPYELREAAEACKAIAEKSPGWLRVQIEEIKKGQP